MPRDEILDLMRSSPSSGDVFQSKGKHKRCLISDQSARHHFGKESGRELIRSLRVDVPAGGQATRLPRSGIVDTPEHAATLRTYFVEVASALMTAFSQAAAIRLLTTRLVDLDRHMVELEQVWTRVQRLESTLKDIGFLKPAAPPIDWTTVGEAVEVAIRRLEWQCPYVIDRAARTITLQVSDAQEERVNSTTFEFYRLLAHVIDAPALKELRFEFDYLGDD